MSGWVAGAVVVAGIGGAALSANAQKKASGQAASAQERAAQLGVDQQNKQFEAIQKLLSPYSQAGTGVDGKGGSLQAQQNLLGLNGNGAQQQAINGIQKSAQFGALAQQGENAILQNASATGGLRGGNTQGALAQFRPALLNGLIDQQYQRLGGLTSIGQNAAAGVGNAGMNAGNQITGLLQQQGAAQAGNAMAQGQAQANMYSGIGNSIGTFAGMGGFGSGSNAPTTSGAPTNVLF